MLTIPRFGAFAFLLVLSVLMSGSAVPSSGSAASTADEFWLLMNRPAILDQAEHGLIRECMSSAKVPYPDFVAPQAAEATAGLLRVPLPLPLEQVRKHGYPAELMRAEQGSAQAPGDAFMRSLSPENRERFGRVLRGDGINDVRVRLVDALEVSASSTGCVADARRQLYGSVRNYLVVFYLPQLAQRQVVEVVDDPELQKAYNDYARRMLARGYRVATPADAVELARSYYPNGRRELASDTEIALATADVECQIAGRLHDQYRASTDRVAIRWISRNEAAISRAYEMLQAALIRATNLFPLSDRP